MLKMRQSVSSRHEDRREKPDLQSPLLLLPPDHTAPNMLWKPWLNAVMILFLVKVSHKAEIGLSFN